MIQFIPLLTLSRTTTAALAAYRFITIAGGYPAAGANALGVTRSASTASGEILPVDVLGVATVEAGAAVAVGDAVEATATGKAITATTGAVTGRALTAASADGDLISVLLIAN